MRYEAYFSPGQETLIRRFSASPGGTRIEEHPATLLRFDGGLFVLRLTSAGQLPEILAGEFLEVQSDRYSLGLRLGGLCKSCLGGTLVFETLEDLELFARRKYQRFTATLWFGMQRHRPGARPLRACWDEAISLRDRKVDGTSSEVAYARRKLSLGAGGLGMEFDPPVVLGEQFLCYLPLDDGQPTVSVLCEVIWTSPEEKQGGARFIGILDEDRTRIDRFVARLLRRSGGVSENWPSG